MSLREYADAGVADLLERSADIIKDRGLAKGVRFDPTDGSVDLVASLAIASGAQPKELLSSVTAYDIKVPLTAEANLHAALDILDAIRPDVETWADHPATSRGDVESLLRQAAMRLRIAVV